MALVLVSAHRGGAEAAPPGSLAAYRAALAMGVDLVELDVRRGAGGELVCSHEEVATGHGSDGSDGPAAGPRLSEVLALVATAGRGAHVDVKEPGYEQELVALVRSRLQDSRCYYTTGDPAAVRRLRALGAPALLTLGPRLRGLSPPAGALALWGDAVPFARIAGCDARGVAVQFRLATPWLRRWCVDRGLAVLVWTVNDDRRLRRLLAMPGVTGVVTDRPRAALELRHQAQ